MTSTPLVFLDPIYRRHEVLAIISMGKSFLHKGVKEGTFPKPIPLGKRARGWRASAISQWIAEREKAAAQDPPAAEQGSTTKKPAKSKAANSTH